MFRAQIRPAQARVPRPPPPPPDPELLLPCGSSPASLPPPNLHQPRLPPHPAGSPETPRRLPPLPSSTTPTTSTTRVVALLPRMATSVRSSHRRALRRQPPPTALDPVVPDHLPPSSTLSRRRDPPSLCSSALEARLMDHAAVTGWAVLLLPSSSHASMRSSHVAHFSVEERRQKSLISKVFSAEKMNHAKTQGGPWWLHCWRNGRGLGCYQGDSKGVYRLDEPLTKTGLYSEFLLAKMDHQLHNMLAKLSQVWSRPRKSQFKSSRRRGVWRFPPPVAALLVFVACSCQIQHDLSYRFSIASLCFMCICAEKMTTPPLFFASHTLPYAVINLKKCPFRLHEHQTYFFV
ncbi:uncharacterized protein LOC125528334 [Triticum urartu]|uniref:uncharacterized protein LOC125528334 n=1 Tax=Triticum urartu TaxID=4572 RepID=UPI002043C99D|nr:uncharacterized protein LOC125528334 [Triticum urartu]